MKWIALSSEYHLRNIHSFKTPQVQLDTGSEGVIVRVSQVALVTTIQLPSCHGLMVFCKPVKASSMGMHANCERMQTVSLSLGGIHDYNLSVKTKTITNEKCKMFALSQTLPAKAVSIYVCTDLCMRTIPNIHDN